MNKKKDKGPVNHHYLARFYLKAWADVGHIYQYDKCKKKAERRGLKRTAMEPYFNELRSFRPHTTISPKVVEQFTADEDGRVEKLIQGIVADPSNAYGILAVQANFDKVIRYIAFQFVQGPGTRLAVGHVESAITQQAVQDYLKAAKVGLSVDQLTKDDLKFFENPDFAKLQHFSLMTNFNRVIGVFAKLNCHIVLNGGTGPGFVTSDCDFRR